ncbi:hypothetical protein KY335_03600 [Candidatus Woesearchaeota archaeon]|nr:hypothetical protein [Candidatus Woesearchaeota archaeon]MBW3014301.1 hypothetical protein [Candidatus Woesearchaeota archaeon]
MDTLLLTYNPTYTEILKHFRHYGGDGATFYGFPADQASRLASQTFAKVLDNVEKLPLGLETEVMSTGTTRIRRDGKRLTVHTEVVEIRLKGKKTVKLMIDKVGADYTAKLRIGSHDVKFNGEVQAPLRKALHALVH